MVGRSMFTKRRNDGTYIEDLPHFTRMLPYVMPSRTESAIYFEQDFDVTKSLEYVREANEGCARPARSRSPSSR